MLIAFHKPYGVLSQFTIEPGSPHAALARFGFPPRVYPIGRLDAASEGLLLLGDEPRMNARLLDPANGHRRIYWAQVERIPAVEVLRQIEKGLNLGKYTTQPCRASVLDPQPDLPPRDPPIRARKAVPDCWISLELTEGKYHQVRRMTASVGHPTLRLIRVRIGNFELGSLAAGEWRSLSDSDRTAILYSEHFRPS